MKRRVELGNGRTHPFNQQHLAVVRSLRLVAIRADVETIRRDITKFRQPRERSLLHMALGEARTHSTASTIFSASLTRISPDISLGRSASRVAASARFSNNA